MNGVQKSVHNIGKILSYDDFVKLWGYDNR